MIATFIFQFHSCFVDSDIEIDLFPIADGGEGTAAILAERVGALRRITKTVDPIGRPIEAESLFYTSAGEPVAPSPARFSDIEIIEPASDIRLPEAIGLASVHKNLPLCGLCNKLWIFIGARGGYCSLFCLVAVRWHSSFRLGSRTAPQLGCRL
jgi:glycerate kinase family protein